jgi:hypothetical protein
VEDWAMVVGVEWRLVERGLVFMIRVCLLLPPCSL